MRALVPDVRMQVELRGLHNFHKAAMYAERADVVLSRVSGQDSRRNWQKQQKANSQQRPMPQMKKIGESNTGPSAGPEPMGIGAMKRRTLNKEEYQ